MSSLTTASSIDPSGEKAASPDLIAIEYGGTPLPAQAAPKDETGGLRDLAIRSSAWTIVGFVAQQAIRFIGNLITTRLLAPEVFGLMAIVLAIIQGISMFCDVGLGPSIVQNPRAEDERFYNTAWTIQVIRGLGIWALTCALALPAARIYKEPMLQWVLPAAGFTAVIGGFYSTSLFMLHRRLKQGKITLLNLLSQLLCITVIIAWAARWPTVWAVVVGQVVGNLLMLALSHKLVPQHRNRFVYDKQAARDLFHFARWIFVSTIFTFLQMQADRFMLGDLKGMAVLGIYATAQMLAQLPSQVITNLACATLYPALARSAAANRDALGETLVRARRLILPVAVAATVGIAVGAPILFSMLYTRSYQEASWMAPMIAVGAWFTILQFTSDRALLSVGHVHAMALGNAMNLVFTIGGCVIGMYYWKLPGFICGVALGNLAGYMVIAISLARLRIWVVRQDLLYTALLLALTTLGVAALRWGQSDAWHVTRVIHPGWGNIAFTTLLAALTCLWAGLRALRWMAGGSNPPARAVKAEG